MALEETGFATSGVELVLTVTSTGQVTGDMEREAAHQPPGVLHLAVSVQLVDPDGGWLLQRRALDKRTFPGLWANSCCTHPRPGESSLDAGVRRVDEELGVRVREIVPAGWFVYRAVDDRSGLVEHELDHVFLARFDGAASPSRREIAGIAVLSFSDARERLQSSEAAPWAGSVLDLAGAASRRTDAAVESFAVGRSGRVRESRPWT